MFTQCPSCLKIYSVTKERLRNNSLVFCSDCSKNFNALELLSEKSTGLIAEAKTKVITKTDKKDKSKKKSKNQQQQATTSVVSAVKTDDSGEKPEFSSTVAAANEERLPWEVENATPKINWLLGFVAALLLLLGQIVYFEGNGLSQNATYRPKIEKMCQWLGCQLEDYKSITELEVVHGSFTPNADNSVIFKAIINNQAAFRQHLPNIRLTLLDYNEQLFAQRIFAPKEYLSDPQRTNYFIAPDETVEASLSIVAPNTRVGGYNLDLIY